jgi:hypothetical protein
MAQLLAAAGVLSVLDGAIKLTLHLVRNPAPKAPIGMTPDLQALLLPFDRVIHEPARLMIITVLHAVQEADFLYRQRECGLTQGNLSSHLAKPEDARYLLIEKTFKGKYPLTLCSLRQRGRAAFDEYVRKIRVVSRPPANGNRASRKLGRV